MFRKSSFCLFLAPIAVAAVIGVSASALPTAEPSSVMKAPGELKADLRSWMDPDTGLFPSAESIAKNELYNPTLAEVSAEQLAAIDRVANEANTALKPLRSELTAKKLLIVDEAIGEGRAVPYVADKRIPAPSDGSTMVRYIKGVGTYTYAISHAQYPEIGQMTRLSRMLVDNAQREILDILGKRAGN